MCVCVEHLFAKVTCTCAGACSTIGILHATMLLPMVGRSQGRLTLYLQGQPPEVPKRFESNQCQPPAVARLARICCVDRSNMSECLQPYMSDCNRLNMSVVQVRDLQFLFEKLFL